MARSLNKVNSKVNDVDYAIEFGGRKSTKVYHVNMLRKWVERSMTALYATRLQDEESGEEKSLLLYPANSSETWEDVEV